MPRPATGQVIERATKSGQAYSVRLTVDGVRRQISLGTSAEGMTLAEAERRRRHILADVERGIWKPPEPAPVNAAAEVPTFHEYASDWFSQNEPAWREATRACYLWQLRSHLLPYFKDHLLTEIRPAEIDKYRGMKLRDGKLSPGQINATLTRLGQILEVAVRQELIPRNWARGDGVKLRVPKAKPIYLESAEQIVAVLDAARDLDGRPTARTGGRRAFMATLIFAGLRISEACNIERRDVDLASGRLAVRESKTEAGIRKVDLLPVLRDELLAHLASRDLEPFDPVFPTARGTRRTRDNARARIIVPVIERANELALERIGAPLPDGVTAHKCRHTAASLLLTYNGNPRYVMSQLGHEDPNFTIKVYSHLAGRSQAEVDALKALIEGAEFPPEKARKGANAEKQTGATSGPDFAATPVPASQSRNLAIRPR